MNKNTRMFLYVGGVYSKCATHVACRSPSITAPIPCLTTPLLKRAGDIQPYSFVPNLVPSGHGRGSVATLTPPCPRDPKMAGVVRPCACLSTFPPLGPRVGRGRVMSRLQFGALGGFGGWGGGGTRGCPTLWGCSMSRIGKTMANRSKNPKFSLSCALCRHAPTASSPRWRP